ncbi:MAG TPA: ECF-type sigma factor, partial [Bryobacteraceae bacterium]|nr:ECF-type sigma factor [Bryobacteraceae bacterium]
TPIVYDELHRLASRYMKRERSGHSLLTTAPVNEAYMRLDLAALDDAMIALGRLDTRKVQVVEMRTSTCSRRSPAGVLSWGCMI